MLDRLEVETPTCPKSFERAMLGLQFSVQTRGRPICYIRWQPTIIDFFGVFPSYTPRPLKGLLLTRFSRRFCLRTEKRHKFSAFLRASCFLIIFSYNTVCFIFATCSALVGREHWLVQLRSLIPSPVQRPLGRMIQKQRWPYREISRRRAFAL